jgi:hypothetical protein
MFKRLAKSGLVDVRLVQSRRTAPGLNEALIHSNDNLGEFRRPTTARKRQSPAPALACRWFDCNGRLECRWQVEADNEAPIADVGILSARPRVFLSVGVEPDSHNNASIRLRSAPASAGWSRPDRFKKRRSNR